MHDRHRGHLRPALTGLGLLLPLLTVAGCPRECRVDGDCPLDDGVLRCSEQGACVPVESEAPKTCEVAGDCAGGRSCFQGQCHFAPTCQRFSDAARLDYVADCDGQVIRGAARLATAGCESTLTLVDLLGVDETIAVGSVPAVDDDGGDLPLTAAGCAAARYHTAKTGFALSGCALGGATCDVAVLRRGEGAPCLDDGHCDGQTCAPLVEGDATLGSCR